MERMGVLGPAGTHSEAAALYLNSLFSEKFQLVLYPDIYDAIQAVSEEEVETCLVPVENAIEGTINITLDTLAHCDDLYIVRELTWGIQNNLLVKDKSLPVKKIMSHLQPLSQCREYIRKNFPRAKLEAVASTSLAASMVANSDSGEGLAAIGTLRAAELNKLEILATNIQDNGNNCTRFYQLRKKGIEDTTNINAAQGNIKQDKKALLILQIDGKVSGQLCRILQELATRNINMTRIESRPAKTALGEYIFFIDVDVPKQKYRLDDAEEDIAKKSIWLKNLGYYQVLC